MNILVLGGNGYLGSKVTRALVRKGDYVVCTKRGSSDLSRLDDMAGRIKWVPASKDGVSSTIQHTPFDCVLNMACNYGRGAASCSSIIRANLEFPLEVLNEAVEHGVRKFLSIGTGLPDGFNMYSFSKKTFNEFGRFYADRHDITFDALLLEMFYGADEPSDRFLPSIVSKMVAGEPVETTVGAQNRDIIAVRDVVKAVLMIMGSDIDGYNEIPVGTGVAPAISEIVDHIWLETGCRSEVRKGAVPMREDEPDCVADTAFLKSIGEWNPISWKAGISEMIEEIRGLQ